QPPAAREAKNTGGEDRSVVGILNEAKVFLDQQSGNGQRIRGNLGWVPGFACQPVLQLRAIPSEPRGMVLGQVAGHRDESFPARQVRYRQGGEDLGGPLAKQAPALRYLRRIAAVQFEPGTFRHADESHRHPIRTWFEWQMHRL